MTKTKKVIKTKKKQLKDINSGFFYVQASFNNTLITATDNSGNVLAMSSAGQLGFKGAKKATPFAATLIGKNIIEKVTRYNLKEADIIVSGVGSGRDSAVRAIITSGININKISDNTPLPHNGCRAKKPRRV